MSKNAYRVADEGLPSPESSDRFAAIINRLPPKQLDQARRILERLEECARLTSAGLPAPIPTFDDILGEGR